MPTASQWFHLVSVIVVKSQDPHILNVQQEIEAYGGELWQEVHRRRPRPFSLDYWLGWGLDAAMRDPTFRAPLFHLVDVLPSLASAQDIAGHAAALFRASQPSAPIRMAILGRAAELPFIGALLARVMRTQTEFLGKKFIVGASWEDSVGPLASLHDAGIGFSLDILGEATHSDHDGQNYFARYRTLIESLSKTAATWPHSQIVQESAYGPIPIANVSVKVSALDCRLDPVATDASVARLTERIRPLIALCRDRNVFVNLDMESWDLHEITFRTFERLVMDDEFRDFPHIGMVLQAYLRNSSETAERIVSLAAKRGTPFTVRLVKGAYWDYEVAHARQCGFACPVFTRKHDTDAQYERLSILLLENHERFATAFASHNLRSITHAIVQADRMGVPGNAYEIQMLNGAARPERDALRDRGLRIRLYAPIGEILPGMAYLVRRLLENSANAGFLRQAYQEHTDIRALLKPPAATA